MQAARLRRSLLRVCHNFFVVGATSSSPTQVGEEDIASRSRGAIFVRARVSRPTMLLTASPLALFPGFPCARPRPQTKGKRNAERRVVTTRALRARGAPCGGARLSASHCGSCQGDSWSPRLCTRPCFGRHSGAFDPMDRQPGRGSCASPRVLPAPENPTKQLSPYSEHLTRRSCCRQADARCRPGAGYKSARGHRARPVPRSVLAKNVPSKGEMESLVRRATWIQDIPAARAIPLI